jgi:hypothetical protein
MKEDGFGVGGPNGCGDSCESGYGWCGLDLGGIIFGPHADPVAAHFSQGLS